MSLPDRLCQHLRRLAHDRRGAVAVLGAVGLLIVVGGTFLATDLTRLHIARTRVQAAADAAMLAAARELDGRQTRAEAIARSVFDANMPDDFLGLTISDFRLVFSSQNNVQNFDDTVQLTVTANMPLFVADLGRRLRPSLDPIAQFDVLSAAVKRTMGAEIVMVLDNTGSMHGWAINALRTSAQILADTVFQGNETVPNLHMGIVNYVASVNIGPQNEDWLNPAARATLAADFNPTTWKGCVMARGALDETDAPIAEGLLDPFLWLPYNHNDAPDPPTITTEQCVTTVQDGRCNVWPGPGTSSYPLVRENQSARNKGYGPNLSCPDAMLPLTPSYSEITAAISRVDAWHRGGTFSNIGLAWGWRMLSPRWTDQWRRPDGSPILGLPYPYDQPFNHKIIVLMTDGVNQHFRNDFTAYGVNGANIPPGGIDASMGRLCDAVKAEGIIIFAITFGLNHGPTINLFQDCASNPATEQRLGGPFFFNTYTGVELETAFRNIGGQIQDLRLIR